MIQNKLFTKLLLVAAMLGVGMSAWAQTTTVGSDDNTAAFWSVFSDYYTLEPNQTLTISFKNYTSKAGNYCNWMGAVTTDADRGASGYSEYVILRADSYGWGKSWVYSNLSSYYNWDTFLNDMDGATVAMTVERNGAIVTIHADITKNGDSTPTYWEEYWTACGDGTQNIRFFLSTEKGHLTDIAASTAANGNTNTTSGWGTLITYNDFSNAIVSNAVAGEKNSLALSGSRWAKGYTSGDPAVTVLEDVLRVGNGSGTVTIPDEELAGSRDEVVISFDYWFGSLSGKNAGFTLYDGAETPVTIASYYDNFYGGVAAENTFAFDESKITSLGSSSVQNNAICVDANKTRFEIHLNYATGKMWALQYTNGTWKQTSASIDIPVAAGKLKSFAVRSNYATEGRLCWFDNLLIQTKRGDYSTSDVSYTVKFVDGNGDVVKDDDTSREALAGTAIADLASTDDMATFYNDGTIANNNTSEFAEATNKYVYKSVSAVTSSTDDTSIDELVDGAIVTIVYDKYNKYDYAVKQKLGDAAATDRATGTLWEDQTYSYYFPKGVKSGDDYYFTDKNADSPYFGGTLTSAAPTVTINYTLDPTAVYYSEGEDIDTKEGTFTHYSSAMANVSCGAFTDDVIVNLTAGIYTITARSVGRADRVIDFYKGSNAEENRVHRATTSTAGTETTSAAFQLTASTDIVANGGAAGGGANGHGLDYVIIRQLPATTSVIVSDAGMATYVPAYDLDFSSSDIKAYKVKVTAKATATLTQVDNVPAGTPVLLIYAGGKTEDIPVMTGAAAVTDNDLVAGTGAAVATTDGEYKNMILNKIDEKVGFYFAAGQTVAANRAYLHFETSLAPDASSDAPMMMIFADDMQTTGVNDVRSKMADVRGDFFDLQGRKVANPTKGLYIVNGKKVAIK